MKNENRNALEEVIENRRRMGSYNPVSHKPLAVGDKFVLSAKTYKLEETPLNGKIYKYFVFKGESNTISEKQLISKGNGINFIKGNTYEERLTSLIEFLDYNEAIISISKIKPYPSSFNDRIEKFCIFNVESVSESEEE